MSVSLLDPDNYQSRNSSWKTHHTQQTLYVEGVLEYLAGGDTIKDLLKEFSDLEKEDFQACLQYALLNMKKKYAEIKARMKFLVDAQLPFIKTTIY